MLFPTTSAAEKCKHFFENQGSKLGSQLARIYNFVPNADINDSIAGKTLSFSAIIYSEALSKLAKAFWQHTGEGVSSRRAEYCRKLYEQGVLVEKHAREEFQQQCKGPKRYRRQDSVDRPPSRSIDDKVNGINGVSDETKFIEERFGRNLNLNLANNAKCAVRRRIAGSLTADVDLDCAMASSDEPSKARGVEGFSEDDVYLYPGGMNSIFNTHQNLLKARGEMKSICFG